MFHFHEWILVVIVLTIDWMFIAMVLKSQVAEEAARRCFSDSLVNKAVRELRKNNDRSAIASGQFTNQTSISVAHRTEELTVSTLEMSLHPDNIALKFSPSNSGYNSHSIDNVSYSSEDTLSRRSASPPVSANFEHSNQRMYHTNNAEKTLNMGSTGTVVESSGGQMTHINYLTSTQREPNLSSFEEPAGSSEKFNQSVAGPSARSVKPIATTDFTRWNLSARSARSQEDQQLPQLSRFGSELQFNQMAGTQSHNQEMVNHMQGSDMDRSSQGISTSEGREVDIRIDLGFIQQAGSLQQENFEHRSFNGPLISPTPNGNSFLDIASTTPQGNVSGYAGHCPIICQYNSGHLISPPNSALHSPNLPQYPSAPVLAGTLTGMRLNEFEAPSPRMALWDFPEQTRPSSGRDDHIPFEF